MYTKTPRVRPDFFVAHSSGFRGARQWAGAGRLGTPFEIGPVNGRTLSGVTRRADARVEPDVDRRVTFDRAVWTKPLAFAADAGISYGR